MKKIIAYLLGLPKSIYVNFSLCTFKDAIRLPIIVSRRVKCISLSGSASFEKIRPGIVRIGFGSVETVDDKHERTLLFIKGKVHFKGKAKIGKGSRISVVGKTTFGNNFHISADAKIICRHEIEFGENILISWETLITDTDHHIVTDFTGNILNKNKPVIIGKNSWIGARSTILKGVNLPQGTILGSNSVVTKTIDTEHCCIAGNPAKIIRKNVKWKE
ncbi:acyltransferase [Grimontia hollisae]|uniref:Maltose O-acetyltransferase n=1 Tax=Grimontia hollisae TaxID=673 RepID=A0A377HIC0_GRIHO|nr:acyltransferase [Grimontia hollisae]AMG30450.1 acyltransferase [Grimontia hollisae]STO41962.1 Maltose O-acetyltransferase [Grimontia hollisae]STO55886.1 Maltose O-acetyltransferase [Grimontia hollisae]STQ77791.1 Maltose O-acetyltransferase [Grimontia hollisae]